MKPVYDLRKQPFTNSQMAQLIGYQAYANARDKKGERAAMLGRLVGLMRCSTSRPGCMRDGLPRPSWITRQSSGI